MAEHAKSIRLEDDEWLDWETRDESVPFWKHAIAGKLDNQSPSCEAPVLASWNTAECSLLTPSR